MSDLKRVLQMQSWERAKGELFAVLATIEKESEGFVKPVIYPGDEEKRALINGFIRDYECILEDEENDLYTRPK